jgi:Family of unknown function (DUF6159)
MKSLKSSTALARMSLSIVLRDMQILFRVLLVQAMSMLVLLVTVGVVGYGLYVSGYFSAVDFQAENPFQNLDKVQTVVALLGIYVVGVFVHNFSKAYISTFALAAIRNTKTSFSAAHRHVSQNLRGLLQFILMSATLGVFLRALEDRLPWAGVLATRIVQGAWNLATVFAVVNIVDGQAKTGVEAAKKSVQQLTTAFGENITVRVGLGALSGIFVFLWLLVVVVGLPLLLTIYLQNLLIAGSVAFAGVVVLVIVLFFISVLESILNVMLYEYTLHGNETITIEKELFKQMISTKKARSVFSHQ